MAKARLMYLSFFPPYTQSPFCSHPILSTMTHSQGHDPLRERDRRHSRHSYTRVEVIYYRLKRYEPPPVPRPPLISLPPDPYNWVCVPPMYQPQSSGRKTLAKEPRHSHHYSDPPDSRRHKQRRRHVHFDDHPKVHLYTPPSSHQSESTHQPSSSTPHPPPSKPFTSSASPSSYVPSSRSTTGLHPILLSFPARLWDLRRRASPIYDPHFVLRFSEPIFPTSAPSSLSTQPKSLRLSFLPCTRTELSWLCTVTVPPFRTHLVVEDVLRAISTELFRRSACWDLYTDHPCFSKAIAAQQYRVREGWTSVPWYEDGIRNVDLYHIDEKRDCALWFRGLKEERLRDGEVVYRVMFSYS